MRLKVVLAMFAVGILFLLAACGGDDDSPSGSTSAGPSASPASSLSPLFQKLASVLLQQSDLPVGLEGGAPQFTTNDDLANGDANQAATIAAAGRQIGADVQFIPT